MPQVKFNKQPNSGVVFSISLLLGLFLLSSPVAAYTDAAFSLEIKVSHEKITVVEQSTFLLESDAERLAFSRSLTLGRSTVSDWKPYSNNIDYHFVGSEVVLNSTEITAKRDFASVLPAGTVVIQYDVLPSAFEVEKVGSRVTRYSLNTSKLKLPRLQSGEIVLGSGAKLLVEIPFSAVFEKVSPHPEKLSEAQVVFQGPLASHLKVIFTEEKTLSDEVNEFFSQATSNTAALIPILLALAVVAFLGYKLISERK